MWTKTCQLEEMSWVAWESSTRGVVPTRPEFEYRMKIGENIRCEAW